MSFIFNERSFEELRPVEFTYSFEDRKEEELATDYKVFSNKFEYFKHKGFASYEDAILSKKTCLILTDNINLNEVIKTTTQTISLGEVASSFYLRALQKTNRGTFFVRLQESNIRENVVAKFTNISAVNSKLKDDTTTDIIFTIVPIKGNIVELIANKTKRVYIDAEYPHAVKITEEVLDSSENYRKQFEMIYKIKQRTVNGVLTDYAEIAFKATLKDGSQRFLSYNFRDGLIRATGTMFGKYNKLTPYIFEAEFVARAYFDYNYDATNQEIKYFTDYPFSNKGNLYIKTNLVSNTHLLATCPTEIISLNTKEGNKVPINFALTKTNFSTSGSYFNKQTN